MIDISVYVWKKKKKIAQYVADIKYEQEIIP